MSKNDITGDTLVSKANNKNYTDNYDRIFGGSNGLRKDIKDGSNEKTIKTRGSCGSKDSQIMDSTEGC